MPSAEIELKFPITNLDTLRSRLPPLGFHLDTPRTFEHNTLYDTPARDLRLRGQILRIRQYGAICTLTHKRHPDREDPTQAERYKIRIETETTLADPAALAEILLQLGYAPTFTYQKYRSEWSQSIASDSPAVAHLVIDETPIGNYAELEGPPAWIEQTLAILQIDPTFCITESYGRLFLAWKQRTNSPAENLTFDAIPTPALSTR